MIHALRLIRCIRRRSMYFFFFQAEDGIRDLTVTGVQTCALPIYFEKDSTISWLASSKSSHLELRRFTFGLYVRRASHVCRNDTVVLVVFGQSCRTGDSISARSCR